MTEADYMLVSALQRLRAARSLLADSVVFANAAVPGSQSKLNATIRDVDKLIGKLERKVDEAMEGERS